MFIYTHFALVAIGGGFVAFALLGLVDAGLWFRLVVATLVSAGILLVARWLIGRAGGGRTQEASWFSAQGKTGVVKKRTATPGKYIVHVEGEEWLAWSDQPLEPGDRIYVERQDGTYLYVRRYFPGER